jgi:hypothetical protein
LFSPVGRQMGFEYDDCVFAQLAKVKMATSLY